MRSPSLPQSQKQAQQLKLKRKATKSIRDILTRKSAIISHTLEDDEFGDEDFNDLEILNAGIISIFSSYEYLKLIIYLVKDIDSSHIDESDSRSKKGNLKQLKPSIMKSRANGTDQVTWNPERLRNGKWACNHKCKDKTA